MKKGLIVFLVFALALVLILGFSGVFKKNGIPQTILTVTATNTEYVVKDDSGNIVPNKSEITIGHSYTITLYENEEYELKTFKINGTSLLTQLENNQYTFLCNGATNVRIISALIVPGGDVISNYTINYISLNHPSGSSMLGWAQQPDIDLLVYDAYENLIAQLDEGESFTPNQNQAYVIDAVFTNCTSTKAITYRFAHGGIWYPFPCNIENVSHNYDLHITYNFLGISFTNTGPITPGDIALVGANVTVTVFNGSCELMVEYIDCVEHSPCTIENCAGWEIKGSFTNPLLENDPVRVGYASGYVNNEYSAKFTVISDRYTIDYIRCADMYGDNWTQFETIPLMSSANNYAYMEIYLKAI